MTKSDDSEIQANPKEIQPRMDTDGHGLKTESVNDHICTTGEPLSPAGIRVHPCSSVVISPPIAGLTVSDSTTPVALPDTHSTLNPQLSTDLETFNTLAALTPAQYDRARQAEATRLGIRLETLDSEVARRRPDVDYEAQARAVKLPPVKPWPEPVDGAEVLTQVTARFTHYAVLPPGASVAIALWDAHTHAISAFLHTPRLNLTSPKPECGKTTVLDLLATMTPRPLRTENITAPVLFRLVDHHQPTLLLDEVDTYLPRAEELRGLLNAGHKLGACAYRCEGDTVRPFKAFGPAVLSGIGALPETLHARSIRILLLPAEAGELTAHFDSRHTEIETILCRKLARWAKDNFTTLQACDPVMPATAHNRVADNWRPLFAIAQIAGGAWPRLALESYAHLNPQRPPPNPLPRQNPTNADLSHQSPTKAEPSTLKLLASIRQIFTQLGVTRILSKQLVAALRAHSLYQQSTLHHQLSTTSLGHRLRRLGISSHNIRLGGLRAKGYDLSDFTEAFARFL